MQNISDHNPQNDVCCAQGGVNLADEQILSSVLQRERAKEAANWREFITNIHAIKLRDVFDRAFVAFLKTNYYDCDSILLDCYGVIQRFPRAEKFLHNILDGICVAVLHPRHRAIRQQLKWSRAVKPKVGDLIVRSICVTQQGQTHQYVATPANIGENANGVPMLRVNARNGAFAAIGPNGHGMIAYVEGEIPENWSHFEVIYVGARVCKGFCRCHDLNGLIAKAVTNFHQFRRHYKGDEAKTVPSYAVYLPVPPKISLPSE